MDIGFRADLILDNKVIIEIKSIETLADIHFKQVLTYLKLTNLNTTGGFFNYQGSEVLIRNIARASSTSLDDIGNTEMLGSDA